MPWSVPRLAFSVSRRPNSEKASEQHAARLRVQLRRSSKNAETALPSSRQERGMVAELVHVGVESVELDVVDRGREPRP